MSKRQANIFVIPGEASSDWQQLPADSLARLKRQLGFEVNLLLTPGEITRVFKINYGAHNFNGPDSVVSHLVMRLQQAGAVYSRNSQFSLCETCGLPGSQLAPCSQCGGNIIQAEREGLYFRFQRYREEILTLLARGDLLRPTCCRDALPGNLNSLPTEDVFVARKVSRTKQKYLPADWFAALAAVMSGCGYPGDEGGFQKVWANSHLFIPRDKQDLIYLWCGALLALQIPTPAAFVSHGPIQIVDQRQKEVSPSILAQNYGHECLRYLLLAQKTTPEENTYPEDQAVHRINHDLASELGSLVTSATAMVSQYAGEMVPKPNVLTRQSADLALRERALETPDKVERYIDGQELYLAVKAVMNLVGATNRFMAATQPRQLAAAGSQERLNTVLYNLCEALRFIAILLKPILPGTGSRILGQLGIEGFSALSTWSSLNQWGLLPPLTKVFPQAELFPRIVIGYGGLSPAQELIRREELARVNMVVARILSAEVVAEYEGLLHLILFDGRQRYSVLAPIARSSAPASLEGKKAVLVSNLRPIQVEGYSNEGEILVLDAGAGGGKPVLLAEDVPEGSKVLCLS